MPQAGGRRWKLTRRFFLRDENKPPWEEIFAILESFGAERELPSVSLIEEEKGSPFQILVSTLISLRTRDAVTLTSSRRLFEQAENPRQMLMLSREKIENLIYPCGFYRMKAENILEISRRILEEYNGQVPSELPGLLTLPGVGLKTANLVLSLGFGIPAICVDTHVHRIANRMGWIKTKKPDDSVKALEEVLPQKYWIRVNRLLVLFGQNICTPGRPRCSRCLLGTYCSRAGVEESR